MTEVTSTAGLSRLQKQELLRKIVAEKRRPRTEPASYAQERLWFLDRLEPGSSTYNIPVAWRLGGALDEGALERALGEIVRRHEALRTTFADRDGSPVQVIAPFAGFALSIDDLSHLADADREAEVRRRAGEEARRLFDLSVGPLFRAVLLRLDAQDHLLLVSMHHIVSDGWSMGVLLRELSALYEAYREGRASPLAELPVQYADYAAWQREQLQGESLNRQLSYWKARLAGAPRVLELPTDRPRPAVRTHRGATVRTELSAEVLERLEGLGRSEGATLYMTLLSAFQVLLSKYSGSEDIVVGSPIAGRTRGEVEGLIGFFINSLVLRTDLSGDPSFRETLRRVREVTLGAYEHQDVPVEKLVAELQPERSMSHSPLFQVSFALNNPDAAGTGVAGLRIESAYAGSETAKFDLSLAFVKGARGLTAALTYSTDLFDESTVRRMLGHLERVLEQVAAGGDLRLSELRLLDEEERHQVLEEWNRTQLDYPAESCLHQLFEAQAERTPHAEAVVFEGERLTYAELNARANRLAHHLRSLGVGPDVRVGICVERSLELAVGLLALLKAGGAYVALDPEHPDERLRSTLDDCRPAVLLAHASLAERFAGTDIAVVAVDADAPLWANQPETNPTGVGVGAEHLVYVIYTSGSTGRPKGVMNVHRNVVNRVAGIQARWQLEPGESVLQNASLTFDVSAYELFWPLMVGARVVMPRPDGHRDPGYLVETIRSHGIGTASFVPSMLQLFLEHPEVERCTSLMRVPCGGEALPSALVRRLHERLPHATLYNRYGPSEAATAVTGPVRVTDETGASAPIGRPMPNARAYLLDAAGEPVPVGVAGELCIGGAAVGRGYLGRPEQTAERFVADPYGGEPGARLYRTGDLARWLADGRIEFLGRNDFQVKIRGFRVEPGEVEAALTSHPGVREARVLAREDRPGEKQLVAYVVGSVDTGELRAHVRRSLPDYMVPAAFVALQALPLMPNGKVDRDALPAPEFAPAEGAYVAPRTPVEEVLAGIWAEVLRLERVGAADNFFELGGHSLLATRVVSRIRAVFGVELPLRALFQGPTVTEMAGRVEQMRRADLPVLPPVVPVDRDRPLPLSFAQERLWFIDRMEPGSAVYNIPMAWRLGGELDVAALERALGEIVRRHESLRTVFTEVDGSPVQVIAPFGGFVVPVEDLSATGDADREAAVRRRAGEGARRPFDLAAGPLFRAALLRVDAGDHVLLISMHHIVSDGWSMGVLLRELSALYAAYRDGAESPLAELEVQYADFAVWQREQLAGEALDGQMAYWKEQLAGAPELLELPTDHPRPAVQTYRGESVAVNFSPELLERLQALGRNEGATLYMVLLGAFQVLLSRYGGGEDVVVGSPIAGRTRGEVEEVIGFFINTLVLRTDLSGDPGFREVLRRVREVTLGAYEHQDVPFEKLVAELQPGRSLSHSPLFQAMFALQNAADPGGELPGLTVGGVGADAGIAKFDLSLTLGATAEGLRGGVNYSTDLFERGTIERMLGHLQRVLEQVATDADVRLSRLELLGAAERALVLDEWNRTAAEVPANRCIHELFEAQAARTPGAVAVSFEADSLTYAELNERANRLAHHLRGRGVRPELRVGVLMERGVEMVVSLLAVLKAGGAYVPLDPGLPAERHSYMLEDSGVAVVLTQERLRGILPASEVPALDVDAAWDSIARESAENLAPLVTPSNVAYVIYTSGSTGRPKGVMNQHRGVVNRLVWMQAHFRLGADDVVLQKTPFSFDVSVWEFFWPLQQGARLVMARPDGHRDPLYLQEVIEREGVTTLHFVPSMLQPFVDVVEAGRCGSLRHVVCSGEALPPALVRRFYDRFAGPVVLTNLYGPTEAAVDVSCWTCPREDAAGVVPIGRPVWNTALYVLDAALQPVPVGVPGELYIGGVQVARGYQGHAAMTAERFVPDPFSTEGGARLYRTGDRARWRADGVIEYLGRLDFQVKVRGFRVELGEIEARLAEHPDVREAVVVAREHVAGETRLVAYVVASAEAGVLREHLRLSLPEYMVPAAFVGLDALPLTANGKLDRKALPAPESDAYARAGYEAPLGEVEAALAEIWVELLGVTRVGRWDHFFELGGHSLLAIRLIERMRRAGLYMEVRALFTTPVMADLALAVGRASSEVEVPANVIPQQCASITPQMLPLVELTQEEIDRIVAGVPGGTANVQDIYPLGPLQEGILFHHLLSRDGDPYLMSSVAQFDTRARLDRYMAALQAVIDRHDVLRTAMAAEGLREPVQVVWRRAPLPVEEVELDAEAGDAAQQLWRRRDPRHYRMDVTRAPLLRVCIAEDRAGGRWLLLLLWHHLVGDHESLEVLQEEISAHLLGRGSELPAPLPFRSYVAQARLGVSREEHERFFTGMLQDVEEPTAPYGMLDVWREGRGIGDARTRVAPDLGTRLRRRARALGVSAASLCHLAWGQVLARLTGRQDVVFGTLLFGRMQGGEGADRVMGPLINTLPVRIGVAEEGAEAAVRRTHALLADLLRHEHASLALAQRCSGVAAPAPLFTSLLNYRHGAAPKRSRDAGQAAQATAGIRRIGAQERTNYPVALSVDDWGEEFSLTAQVAAPADAEQVCRLMHTALERLVEALEVAPGRAIGSIDVLAEGERRQVVEEWNRTEAEYPAERCIHELFQEQAARTPGAVAVRFREESLTYGELNERANRLAHHLAGLGVGPETRVALCLERGPEMVISVLAVLKAGGAYVPLDPAYPAERLAFMLADAAVPVLVTQESLRAELSVGDGVAVVSVDGDGDRVAAQPAANPERGISPEQLAYVIYTSGSTGTPKGVLVRHGSLANLLAATREAFGVGEGDVMPVLASYAFDIWLFEALLPLTSGGAVRLVDRDRVLDTPALLEEIADATLVHAVPALMRQLVQAERETPRLGRLRRAFVGGDRVPADLLAEMREALPGAETHVLYGPTEGTILASTHPVPADGIVEGHPIGRPLGNVRLYVCDPFGSPQPAGVPGELLIGGAGVARGYLGRPELTAERFVPDPFSAEGARLYRTGDRARWRADGTLEFLGRVDTQVKVRGFRIEPGEIEAVLRAHERVAECVVEVREDEAGGRLVAYVVPAPRKDVELWPSIGEYFVYDDLIYHGLTHDTLRNERYLRALRRHAPGKVVLDVGTGADAILARLAVRAGARHVYAVELLEASYLSARERVRELGLEDRITVIHGNAATVELPELADVCVSEIVESIAGGEGAALILNGVRRLLAPGAVMIPQWAGTRVAAVTLPDELRSQPGFSPTAAHYVRGIFEEVGYPFDLRLCIRNFPAEHLLSTAGTYEDLHFGAGPVDAAYTRREELVVERAGRMDGLLLWLRMVLAEGEELDILEEETAWFPVYFPLFEPGIEVAAGDRVHLECWAEVPEGVAPDYGARGVLVRGRDGEEVPFEFASYHHRREFRASPFYRRLFADAEVPALEERRETLPASLREHAQRSLPEYMVPSAIVVLDALPLTPNGKLDRKALPAPEYGSDAERYVAPRTPVEEVLAGIWAEVLRLERAGVTENFFELGGHSLLATRAVSRIREVFGVELPLRALFEGPTVAELAVRVEEMRRAELPLLPPVVPTERTGLLPLSFAQERLWFIDRLQPGSAVYNIPLARRLAGALDVAALERALGEIVRRHEALRTVFAEVDGSPVQVIAPFGGFALPVEDLSELGEADREAEVRRRAGEEPRRAFDLAAGPLFRAALVRVDAEDHVLLLSMHHTVSDEWSMGVLFREMSALYAAYREGRESPLPELPVQYADYAVWQREQLAGAVLDRQLAYWRERLAGAPELLELPTDHPRPAVQTYRGATVPVELSPQLLERLRALGRSDGATLYMTLLSAFQVLLSKYGGSEDVVVGSPIAGRTRREVEELIGFFVNTLVLRADLSGDPSFRETLRRVREAALGADEHQEVPFEKLVAELQPERSLSHSPLFQVMFTLQDAGPGGAALPGLRVGGVGAELASAQFDLSLTLAATPQGLRGGLNYSTDLFDRGTIERMLGHLQRVLEQAAARPEARLSELDLLGEAERRLVLHAWNDTAADYPADRCIHELFQAQAARTPHAVALRFEGESLTYAVLNERANRLAQHLRGHGVGPEVPVGVLMERSVEMVVSLLAVLKAGGAYVPLDPGLPAERLAYMLDDSAVPLVLVQAALREAVPAREGVGVLAVDALAEEVAAESTENPPGGPGPDSLAYVIYTSGSTGRPKGVMNTHRGVVNLLWSMRGTVAMAPGDRLLAITTFAFDISVLELFLPLLSGARVEILDRFAASDPARLRAAVGAGVGTVLQATPATWRLLLDAGWEGAENLRALSGGEALPGELAARLRERVGALWNVYGPTETTIWSTAQELGAGMDGGRGHVSIGAPVANTRVYVLDRYLAPVPAGVPGELYIGGAGVARGYLGRPGLSAERFVPDPFSAESGARLYRTGDRARWRPDGTLEFLGRNDHQVKVRGFRIELGEIEAVLRQHESVTDCVVVTRADVPGDPRLVAYLVADAEAEAFREHLRRSLPEYMVPAAFVGLDALPLTPNGKLDRKALPAPEDDAYARGSYEAPLGEVEAALTEIWAEVLAVERVGRWDHFFELGGHSLLAIRLIERMRRAGLYMEVRALFTTPVLAELALAVGGASSEVEVPANAIPQGAASITPEMLPLVELSLAEIERIVAGVPGGAANVQDIYPLAPLQEGILFHHQMSQEGDPYLLSSMTEFDTRARLEQYLAALQAVIDRHDILRTAMAWEELRDPVQVVWRHAPLPVEEVQLDAETKGAAGQLWRRYDPRRYRMDVGRAPLLRACIAEDRARGRWMLLILAHHLMSDHESLEVLKDEISAHLAGRESELPVPQPFRNYVAQARLGVSREEHERFFRGMLHDVQEPTAPYGMLDVWGEGRGIGEASLSVAPDVSTQLRRRARALGVSAASLCHLAWAQVVARLSGRQDVVFGTVLFGRMQGGEGADRVMGPLINTLPVRIGVGREGVEAAVRRTHALMADLLRHEHASLALAQRSSGVAAPAPLFTSLLNYRHGGARGPSKEAGPRSEEGRNVHVQERTNYPVSLSVNDLGERFSLSAQVAAPADAERVCRMMHTALERLVEALEATPARAIGSIDVLPEAERRIVVEEWNRTDAEYRRDVCVHELFEAQVERAPDAVALVYEDQEVSYAALNARANRLAHHLRALGVGPEARVALCVERGVEMVAAVLAVLKAGGAYVPLDPEYPQERLGYMLKDSAPVVLLAQGSLAGRFGALDVPVEVLDGDASPWTGQPDSNPGRGALTPDNLAYVIYTSGSTGQPKGVMNRHRGVINLLAWGERHWEFGAGDALLQLTSFSFDVSVRDLFTPLLAGARLVLVRPGGQREVDYVVDVVRRQEVSTMALTPSQMQAFLDHPELERCSSLRRIVMGGESIPAGMVAELRARLPGARLYHEYGPTEATVTSMARTCGAEGEASGASIGGPISNTRVYLLDARGEPVPVGVGGELYVGGAGVARGYLGRPALTAQKFVPDPFGAEAGARLYRTGDLGRWLADGTIEFLGRVDTQVKVRGYRIEPGEIEARLREREEVSEAVVAVHEDQAGNRRLVAYVVGDADVGVLREHLRRELPEYMVPAAFVSLERLPLTPSGKLDRKALPAPEHAAAGDLYVAPRTPTEEVLAGIWAELLGLERVGVEESFFDLGGHSLLATRLVSQVRAVFNIELPLRALFEAPTVAELARAVAERGEAALAGPVAEPAAGPEASAHHLLDMIDELSEEELDRLLGAQS
ncbi:non-ribosomal peptide synthase/polyketide synthase [Longimicrobium sp.]|uniref:non-ribosomal peptide synthase/polyketide synthase n=1 Tax=Longimicrobium sp. TaxID=2029185 RepID=UPI002F92ED36